MRRDAEIRLQPAARLGQDIQGAGLEHLEDIVLLLCLDRNAQHQDRQRRPGHDDPGKLDAVHFRHVQIGADDVGPDLGYQLQRLGAVGRRTDDLDLGAVASILRMISIAMGESSTTSTRIFGALAVCGGLVHQISLSRQSSNIF